MYAVVDSVGFRRRTEQTELILAPVLSANIYVIVTGPLVNINCREWIFNNGQLNVPSVGSIFFAVETIVCSAI